MSVNYILVVRCMYITHRIMHAGGMHSGIVSPGDIMSA